MLKRVVLLLALTLPWAQGRGSYECPLRLKINTAKVRCCRSELLPHGCECFDISRFGSDYTNTFGARPQCPEDVEATFTLFNDAHKEGKVISATGSGMMSSGLDPSLPIYMIVHGFTDSAKDPWLPQTKDELLKNAPCNVILVDWQKGASGPNYYQATANTRTVGAMVGKLAFDIHMFLGVPLERFHLIGHSLGAHTMGYAGAEVFRQSGRLLGRVTGLDPAGPAFEDTKLSVHLDSTDAVFVDIIHTDAEKLMDVGYGIQSSSGNVDFFANGGIQQPGCPPESSSILSMLNFEDEVNGPTCSHARAVYLFANSINTCSYKAPEAPDYCTMGFHTRPLCVGDQYVNTTGTAPYC